MWSHEIFIIKIAGGVETASRKSGKMDFYYVDKTIDRAASGTVGRGESVYQAAPFWKRL